LLKRLQSFRRRGADGVTRLVENQTARPADDPRQLLQLLGELDATMLVRSTVVAAFCGLTGTKRFGTDTL
jgi:hypothetical protein